MSDFVSIDGSQGEGGGQILRTALALSAICKIPVEIRKIRANRKKPGLRPQHLTGVKAMAQLCAAEVTGAREGSDRITFAPTTLPSGTHRIDIGTAGSTALLLHTLYYPILFSEQGGDLELKGGTHNEMAPSFPYLQHVWAPLLHLCGFPVDITLQRFGFYPKGGGKISIHIPACSVGVLHPPTNEWLSADHPPMRLTETHLFHAVSTDVGAAQMPPTTMSQTSIDWTHRPTLDRLVFYGLYVEPSTRSRRDIPERMAKAAAKEMPDHREMMEVVCEHESSASIGAMCCITCHFGPLRVQFTAHGARGIPAEDLGKQIARETLAFLDSGACLDPWAADQMLLPLALSGQSAQFTTSECSQHLLTNADIISMFLPDCAIEITPMDTKKTRVDMQQTTRKRR